MRLRIALQPPHAVDGFRGSPEGYETFANWVASAEPRVLHHSRLAGGQITDGPIAEPAATGSHVDSLRD